MDRTIALVALHAGYSHASPALRSIAAFCRDEPFYPRIRIHEAVAKTDLTWLTGRIVAERPALVGLSTYLWNIGESLRLASVLAQVVPDVKVVLGGPEAGPRAAALLSAHPFIDWVVCGEGELAFRDLARLAWRGAGSIAAIPGLAWRDAAGVVRLNPISPLPLEDWRPPLAAGLDPLDKPLVYWETARGCPFRCSFCTSATEDLRPLPWPAIEADLAILAGVRDKTVKVLDRSFHLGRQRTLALLRRFLDTPDTLRFHLELNPDRISDEAMALFASAPPGKFQFEIGLQTLDPATLERIDRALAEERVGPERVFDVLTRFLSVLLDNDPCLQTLLAWDYASQMLPGRSTPARLMTLLTREPTHTAAETRRRLLVLAIDARAAGFLSRHRLDPLAPGRYALWPQRHRKGLPVELFRLG